MRRQAHFWGDHGLNRTGSERQEREREEDSAGRPGWGCRASSREWSRLGGGVGVGVGGRQSVGSCHLPADPARTKCVSPRCLRGEGPAWEGQRLREAGGKG